MRYRQSRTKFEKILHKTALLTFALFAFLTESTVVSPGGDFRTKVAIKKYTQRLPASLIKDVFDFDCAHPQKNLEISTQLETFRLNVKNCSALPELKNSKHNVKLYTFKTNDSKYSTEYAYLARGENKFSITANNKEYQISIFRY